MIRRTACAVAAVGMLAAAAGCGGGTKKTTTPPTTAATTATEAAQTPPTPKTVSHAAYVTKMRALGRTIGTEINLVYPLDTGLRGSAAEAATLKRLAKAQVVIQGVLVSVRGLRPPAAIVADQRRLERGLAGVADELGQTIRAIRAGDFRAAIVPSRLPDLGLITTATTRMENKGFDVLGKSGG
ncbi:MAG TPA: hypothetical protein VGG88_12160 [Gaiellaceae bacterium]